MDELLSLNNFQAMAGLREPTEVKAIAEMTSTAVTDFCAFFRASRKNLMSGGNTQATKARSAAGFKCGLAMLT